MDSDDQESPVALKDDMLLDAGYLHSVYESLPGGGGGQGDGGALSPHEDAFRAAQESMPPGWWINPYCLFRTRWDLALVVILCYNGYVIPLRLAFEREDPMTSPVFWLDRLIDFIFLADVVLNFRTGTVTRTGHVVYKDLMWRYLTSWFLLDLVSAVPYELVLLAVTGEVSTTSAALQAPKLLRTARIFKVFKVLKLFRLVRLKHIFSRFEKALVIKHSVSTVMKFCCSIFFIAHWCACIFYAIGANTQGSWLDKQGLSTVDDLSTLYVASFYWSLSTITTIGYGDISAENPSERLFALAAMIVGSAGYAYGITHVITLVSNINSDRIAFRQRMDRLNTYMRFRNLPKPLQADIRNFFYERSGGENWHELLKHEREILNDLSPLLRTKVALLVNKRVIEAVPFFANCPPRFVMDILMALKPEYFPPMEYVVLEGDVADRMYLVANGRVDVLKWGAYRVSQLGPGSYFGEMALLNPPDKSLRCASVRTTTYVDCRSLSYDALERALARHPQVREGVLRQFVKHATRRRRRLAELMSRWSASDEAAARLYQDERMHKVVHVQVEEQGTLRSFYRKSGLASGNIRDRRTPAGACAPEEGMPWGDSDQSGDVDIALLPGEREDQPGPRRAASIRRLATSARLQPAPPVSPEECTAQDLRRALERTASGFTPTSSDSAFHVPHSQQVDRADGSQAAPAQAATPSGVSLAAARGTGYSSTGTSSRATSVRTFSASEEGSCSMPVSAAASSSVSQAATPPSEPVTPTTTLAQQVSDLRLHVERLSQTLARMEVALEAAQV